jgi:hypothetical protein
MLVRQDSEYILKAGIEECRADAAGVITEGLGLYGQAESSRHASVCK